MALRGSTIALIAAVLVGLAAGIGAYTFAYARGWSYLTDDPAACANCHIMGEHFAAWTKASHRAVAGCNDCHTPKSFVGKYATKASNGFWHSYYFTLGGFPDPLRATPGAQRVTEQRCRDCHAAITEQIDPPARTRHVALAGDVGATAQATAAHADPSARCVRCHRYVGHWVR
jgi:cytochrome c nitrite reductase small subunit